MKNIIAFCFCVLMITPIRAQIDEKRMQRDLDISKNILSSLLDEEGYGRIIEHRIEASYVDGFGVIFKIPRSGFFFNYNYNFTSPNIEISPDEFRFGNGTTVHVYSESKVNEDMIRAEEERAHAEQGLMEAEQERIEAEQELMEAEQERLEAERQKKEALKNKDNKKEAIVKKHSYSLTESGEQNKDQDERDEALEKAVITFLTDYADLIGQLKPDDKIMVKKESDNESFAVIWDNSNGEKVQTETGNGMSVTALKKDISAYKADKLDRDTFISKLDIKKGKKKERIADLEIFGNVFRQYFSPEYSRSFFTNGQPDYELLEGMGVIFKARTLATYSEDQIFYLPPKGQISDDDKERKEKIESLYPKFLDDLKSFIVDYGRTIRSLQENEKLIMKIELTRCDACSIPNLVEATVSMSTLINYDQQKISKEKALAAIELKEVK